MNKPNAQAKISESSLVIKPRLTAKKFQWKFGIMVSLAAAQAVAQTPPANINQQAVSNALSSCYRISFQADSTGIPDICIAGTNSPNLQSLTPDQIFSMGSMATRVDGGKVTQPSDYFRLKRNNRYGGGAGDEDFSRLGFWAKTDNDFGSLSDTPALAGFKFDNHNFVFGADYRLQDNWVVGSSFAYRHNNASFSANRGETLNDSYTGNLYTSYNITDALHVDATASYGGYSYETTRNITLAGIGSSVAKGSPEGGQYAFSWGGGYDFNFKALTIAPYARGEYMNLDIDSYSETGSIGAVRFAKQNIESLTSTLGVQTAYTFSFPWGVLIPQLRGEWHHQYLDGQRLIQASFVDDPTGQNFTLSGAGPSRDYYTFGAEVSSVLPGGISAFLAYETLQGYTHIDSNKLMLGGRLEF